MSILGDRWEMNSTRTQQAGATNGPAQRQRAHESSMTLKCGQIMSSRGFHQPGDHDEQMEHRLNSGAGLYSAGFV